MKIVKNVCYGCYGLSEKALLRLVEITGKDYIQCQEEYDLCPNDETRAAPELVQVVEELGNDASDEFAALIVVEIPNDVEWYISDYDGLETIEEVHGSW